MSSLIAALAGSCAMSWLFKISGRRNLDTALIAFWNYLTAACGLWICYLLFPGNRAGGAPTAGMIVLSCALAFAMIVNLISLNLATASSGVGSATFFNRIGFLVSLGLAALCWREIPGALQAAGILCLLGGLFVMLRETTAAKSASALLAVLSVSSGMVIFWNAVYGRLYSGDMQILFLAVVFTLTLAMSAVLLYVQKKRQSQSESERQNERKSQGTQDGGRWDGVIVGTAIGLANIVTTLFTLRSYAQLDISIVAPVMSGGNMIFAALLGRIVYHEEFSRKTALAIFLACVSLVLVNW